VHVTRTEERRKAYILIGNPERIRPTWKTYAKKGSSKK
jgi:hypothetical protein